MEPFCVNLIQRHSLHDAYTGGMLQVSFIDFCMSIDKFIIGANKNIINLAIALFEVAGLTVEEKPIESS